jgi:Major Facilitator Superfamily
MRLGADGSRERPRDSLGQTVWIAQSASPTEPVRALAAPRSPLVAFGAIMLATLLAAMDQTIVATALPRIVGDLNGFSHLSWVITAYLITSTVTIPAYGKLSDLYGRRRMFVVSTRSSWPARRCAGSRALWAS